MATLVVREGMVETVVWQGRVGNQVRGKYMTSPSVISGQVPRMGTAGHRDCPERVEKADLVVNTHTVTLVSITARSIIMSAG